MKITFFLGVALDNLDDDTTDGLRVYVSELAPFSLGDIDKLQELAITVRNLADKTSNQIKSVNLKEYISVSTYFGSMLNMRRPNVAIGEYIGIISLGNDSEFMWFPINNNSSVRTTELFEMFIANRTPDQIGNVSDESNSYTLKIDSREGKKKLQFLSNKNNSEPYIYDLLVDISKGIIDVKDDVGNSLNLVSKDGAWTIVNTAGDKLTMKGGNTTVDTNKYVVNAPDITLNGEVNTTKSVQIANNLNVGGNTTLMGTLTVNGAATFMTTVTATGMITAVAGITSTGPVTSTIPYTAPGGLWHNP